MPEMAHQCSTCAKIFKSPSGLQQHQSEHLSTSERTCKVCGEILKSRMKLLQHEAKHVRIFSSLPRHLGMSLCARYAAKTSLTKAILRSIGRPTLTSKTSTARIAPNRSQRNVNFKIMSFAIRSSSHTNASVAQRGFIGDLH